MNGNATPQLTPPPLPEDVSELQGLVRQLIKQLAEAEQRTILLQEQVNLLSAKRFGASSEKSPSPQRDMFNEAETEAQDETAEVTSSESETDETVEVPAHRRKKRGRKPLPEILERVRIEHDLDAAEKACPCGCGEMTRIGEEISEQLDIIPAQVRVLQHVRFKYACKQCEEGVHLAPLPPQPIPKSLASPGLLAHIAIAKYQDALPLHRQESILARVGIELGRQTLAGWMIQCRHLINPLISLFRDHLDDYDIRQMDETTVQVLNEAGRKASAKSYMWLQRGGPPEQPVILFDYASSRSRDIAQHLLSDYEGWLVTDGYDGYNGLSDRIIRVGCWAHARRKFDEAIKAQGKGKGKIHRAHKGLAFIQSLYRIERTAQEMTSEERHQLRQDQAKPVLEKLKTWLDEDLSKVPPKSTVGKALHYLSNQWHYLIRYLDDGRLPIDNNASERAIRPFVVGRKNWLFSATPKGAEASAKLYSLIETAKANGHEPYGYLRYVFKELPAATTLEAIEQLLPWNLTSEQVTEELNSVIDGGR